MWALPGVTRYRAGKARQFNEKAVVFVRVFW